MTHTDQTSNEIAESTSDDPAVCVIFIHGLWMTGFELSVLRRRVARAGYCTQRFRYFSLTRSLEDNVARLHAFIHEQFATTVHLIGHSLGGILILQLLQKYTDIPPGRVVMLGSPIRGSQVARVLQKRKLGTPTLGQSGPDVLAARHQPSWHGERQIGVVAGTLGVGIGRLVTRLPKPHDGMVAVAETQLPGAADVLHLPVTHLSIVFSSTVAQAVCRFLAHGNFLQVARVDGS